MAFQGGMEGGCAAAELLTGRYAPSGKLADTYARDLEDYPGCEHFYDSDDYVNYDEDIYVGYRYFETIPGAKEKVVYPFGYGLGYTQFALSGEELTVAGGRAEARVRVLNVGDRAERSALREQIV